MSTEASQVLDQTQPAAPAPTPTPQTSGVSTDATPAPQASPNDKLSSKFEILQKRDQEVLSKLNALKSKEAEIEAKLARITEFESAKGNSKKALELLGLTYDELTQSLLQDGSIPPEAQIRKLDQKLEEFKTEQQKREEEMKAAQEKAAKDREDKVITDFKGEIGQYLEDNSSRYELIKFEEQQDLVFSVIDEHYNRTIDPETGIGKVMTIKEAADKVELFLEQKYEKSRQLNKVKTLWGAVPQALIKKATEKPEALQQKPKTLTNNITASPTPQRRVPISDEERIQRAIAYAKTLRPNLG